LKRSFLSEPFPAQLYLTKSKCESQLKMICGGRYEDPSSPIDQAWKAAEKTRIEKLRLNSETKTCMEALTKDYGYDRVRQTFVEIMSTVLNLDNPEELSAFDPRFIPAIYAVRKAPELESQFYDEFAIYRNLDFDRAELTDKLNFIGHELYLFNNPSTRNMQLSRLCTKNEFTLSSIFRKVREVEQLSKELPLLREISDAIQVLLDNPQEVSLTALEKIRLLINSHSAKNEIWKTLYQLVGNGIIEDSWAEKHFHTFLPGLKRVIKDAIEYGEGSEWAFHH
jgi:hypothetical protein